MLDAEQKYCLSQLPKATLVNFIAEVQGVEKLLDKKIERLLLQSDKPKLIKKLTSNLKGLRRRHKYIDYWELNEFATELQYLASDITSLYPEQPETCLNLLELFIESSNSSIERCDDANGEIEEVYSSLAESWLKVASTCYEQEKLSLPVDEQDILSQAWQAKVKTLINDNDYGTKDALISGIKQLLSKSEMRGLIADYKQYYESLFSQSTVKNTTNNQTTISYNNDRANHQEKLKTETALIGLTQALGDISLFEAIYLKIYPKQPLTPQQLSGLLQFMIDHKAYEVAQRYLNHEWQSKGKQDELKRLDWLTEIYQQQGNTEAQLQMLGEAFELRSSPVRLRAIMAIASPAEQAQWRKKAYKLAEQQKDITMATSLLLEINETALANQVAVTRYLEFADIHYENLTGMLKELPEATQLIQVIIYRSLIDDILDNVRSKAYGYAARYYKRLTQLDITISKTANRYSSLVSHQDYMSALSQKHDKKYSFWERVDD